MSKIGESIEIENGFVVFYGSKQVEWWVTAMSIVCLGVKKKGSKISRKGYRTLKSLKAIALYTSLI